MLTLRGKDFRPTRHASDGASAEGIHEATIHRILEEAGPAPELHVKQETTVRRGRRLVIVRWIEREDAIYVPSASATRAR